MLSNERESIIKDTMAKNPALAEELEKAESIQDFCETFSRFGVEITDDEANLLIQKAISSAQEVELSEDGIEAVSGGITWQQAKSAFRWGARVGIAGRMAYDYYTCGNATKSYSYSQLRSGKFW